MEEIKETKIDINSENFVDAILSNKPFETIVDLSKKANLNYIYMSKYTPTIAAVLIEDIALLEFLRKQGADLNQTNSYNQTALHAAFRYNKVDAAKYLLAIPEVKKDIADIYGTKPIDWAKYSGYDTLINVYKKMTSKDEGLTK